MDDHKAKVTSHFSFDAVLASAEAAGQSLHFPKEILWLGGAPGAGKGTHTEFIKHEVCCAVFKPLPYSYSILPIHAAETPNGES